MSEQNYDPTKRYIEGPSHCSCCTGPHAGMKVLFVRGGVSF
jgi:hypothetical protein